MGGSLAYADPAAEWPACVLALDATLVLVSAGGERRVAASDFFTGLFETALAPGELIAAVELPVLADHECQVFDELARRRGDYAIAGLAARGIVRDGRVSGLRLAFLGVDDRPLRAARTEAALEGATLDDAAIALALQTLAADLKPFGDLTSNAATKRHLTGVLTQRALRRLAAGAGAGAGDSSEGTR